MTAPASTAILNDAQRAALDLGRDLLVSAGAGAGKTQVLGLRYLAILEEGLATVPEIIAFTFTEKAAAEMRERVQKLLLERIGELASGDKTRLERLQRAQAEFARNRISTVHGFCHRLLKEFAWEAGLEPHAPILEERAQSLARENAIKRVLMQTRAEDNPELAERLVRLGSVERLYSLTGTLGSMLRDRAFIRPPLQRAVDCWQDPQAEIARRLELWQALVQESLAAAIDAAGRIDKGAVLAAREGDKLRVMVEQTWEAIETKDWALLRETLLTKAGTARSPGGAKSNWSDEATRDRVKAQVVEVARALEPAGEILDAPVDPEFERRVGGVVQDLAAVFEAVCAAYEEELGGGLDFLELELRALELLRGDESVRGQVIRKARFLLVDEYQDTNPTQAELFELLTRGDDTPGRFFAVGDSKQSIYAFRGSDVRVFNHAMDWIPRRNENTGAENQAQRLPWGLTCQDTPERRSGIVRLEHNYRTVQPLLETGNDVFRAIFARDDRDFDARPQDMLYGSDKETEAPALEFHLLPDNTRWNNNEDEQRRKDDEAELVAQRVKQLHQEGTPLKDITILVRTRNRNRHYRNAFARHNLPLLVVGEGGLFETQEALDCVNLLRTLANPGDDIAMLGVLRSPFAALSDVYLTRLALEGNRFLPLLERVRQDEDRPPEAERFIERFDQLHKRAGRDAPALLLTEALSAFAYPLAVGCGADAEQRLANVGRIVELVREMQHELPSLAPLVRELRERIDRAEDETQGVPDRSADGVRLMTVHKSKGLEFPVVILPELGNNSGGGEFGMVRYKPARQGEPLGLHLKRLDDEDDGKHRGKSRADFAAWLAKRDAKERDAAEEKRVLYVAWTRAEKRLVLTASVNSEKEFDKESWAHQLLRAFGANAWREGPDFIQWHDGVERADARPHTDSIDRVQKAQKTKVLPLPESIDTSLVGPLETVSGTEEDEEKSRKGKLIHDVLERCLDFAGAEIGFLDVKKWRAIRELEDEHALSIEYEELNKHLQNAAESISLLGPAENVAREFEIFLDGERKRLDLLRYEGDGRYDIIDYKTGDLAGDPESIAIERYSRQLNGYEKALIQALANRGQTPKRIRKLVCFTAPDGLKPAQRLVEIRS